MSNKIKLTKKMLQQLPPEAEYVVDQEFMDIVKVLASDKVQIIGLDADQTKSLNALRKELNKNR